MEQQWTQPDVTTEDGVVYGPFFEAVLRGADAPDSVHNPEVAKKMGLRGALVASLEHLDLFPRVLLHLFGPRWFETGTISMYYVSPVVGGERVRACVDAPPEGARDVQLNAWVERDDGMRVIEGTVSVGEVNEPTALRARDIAKFEPGDLKISPYAAGDVLDTTELQFGTRADEWPGIDQPVWPGGTPPFPQSVANLSALAQMHHVEFHPGGCAGMDGAFEVRFHRGPVLDDTNYKATLEVVYVGQTPQTELVWYDNQLTDGEGNAVADVRRMFRWVKSSHPAYQ